jgi:hypothetical protein
LEGHARLTWAVCFGASGHHMVKRSRQDPERERRHKDILPHTQWRIIGI